MEIINEYPPNYDALVKAFDIKNNKSLVFTYGNKIYNPYSHELPDHIIVHETVHMAQQFKIGVEAWWDRYIKDAEFRLDQETEAYREQYKFVKENYTAKASKMFLGEIASLLASEVYGSVVSYHQAESLIRREI